MNGPDFNNLIIKPHNIQTFTSLGAINFELYPNLELFDISEKQNKSIVAWIDPQDNTTMFFSSTGYNTGILMNENSSHMFEGSDGSALVSVYFESVSCLTDTNYDFSYMFSNNKNLTNIFLFNINDYSTHINSKITAKTASHMFYKCPLLSDIDSKQDLKFLDTADFTRAGKVNNPTLNMFASETLANLERIWFDIILPGGDWDTATGTYYID